jgi:hypothetical protein
MTEQLLAVARAYCAARELSLSRVSTIVFNDGKKLDAIALRGADLGTGKYEQAMLWFSVNWPVDAEWPFLVTRPPLAAADAAEVAANG